jgi:hypothetical protein
MANFLTLLHQGLVLLNLGDARQFQVSLMGREDVIGPGLLDPRPSGGVSDGFLKIVDGAGYGRITCSGGR